MKTTKKLILFIICLTIASMIVILSCKNRYTGTGPGDKGVFETGQGEDNSGSGNNGDTGPIPLAGSGGGLVLKSGYKLPQNSLSQEEQEQDYDPDFNSVVLFANGKIPALTVTKSGVILAAAGTGESHDYITVKRSSDMGKTWADAQATTDFGSMYTHPFFINCHDGGVLMGVATTNKTQNKTVFYKSTDNGATWTKQKEIQSSDITNANLANSLVNFGQGITLRHGGNSSSQKLMFPYFYYRIDDKVLKNQKRHTAIMCSTDDGANFSSVCTNFILGKTDFKIINTIGDFTTYEPKLLELANGDVLLAMFNDGGKTYWVKSTDCGSKWTFGDINDGVGGKRLDLVRYEFNGKPIKNKGTDNGDKYALMIYSTASGNYGIKMSTNDFNSGANGTKYHVEKDLVLGEANTDGYPAITTLPDGTIATLTDENNGVVFRRFNLYWLSDGLRYIDYSTDLQQDFNN